MASAGFAAASSALRAALDAGLLFIFDATCVAAMMSSGDSGWAAASGRDQEETNRREVRPLPASEINKHQCDFRCSANATGVGTSAGKERQDFARPAETWRFITLTAL